VSYRDGRGIRLTEAGKRLQVRGKNIMVEIAAARVEMTNVDVVPSGRVVLGIQPAIGTLLSVPIEVDSAPSIVGLIANGLRHKGVPSCQ